MSRALKDFSLNTEDTNSLLLALKRISVQKPDLALAAKNILAKVNKNLGKTDKEDEDAEPAPTPAE